MNNLHHNLEKRYNWYQHWHHSNFSNFIHWFILIIFSLSLLLNTLAYTQTIAEAANAFTIDSEANWAEGAYTNSEADGSGNLELSKATFANGWSYKWPIAINADSVISSSVTDWPALITDQHFPADVWAEMQATGADLRFTSDEAGNNELYYDDPILDVATEKARLYVQVPTLASGADTTIYAWVGNAGASAPDAAFKQSTYSSDIKGWYPIEEGSGTTIGDRTSNSYDFETNLMDNGDWVQEADDSWSLTFSGLNGVYAGRNDSCGMPRFSASILTRFYAPSSVDGGALVKIGDSSSGYGLGMGGTRWEYAGDYLLGLHEAKAWRSPTPQISVPDSSWYSAGYVVGSSGDNTFYLDGTLAGSMTDADIVTPANLSGFGGYNQRQLTGSIGHVALFGIEATADQNAVYNLMLDDPSAWAVAGSKEFLYSSTASYTSAVKDMSYNRELTNLTVAETLPANTSTTYFARTGPTDIPDGSWTGWAAVSNGNDPAESLDSNRYLQVKVDLTSNPAQTATPSIDSITVDYQSVGSTSAITSPANGSTFGPGAIAISGTVATNDGATISQVEISTNGGTTWANTVVAGGTWSHSFTPGASGTYNIKTRASNNDAITETPSAGISLTFDIESPSSTVSSPNANQTIGLLYNFAGTATDTGGGTVGSMEVKISKKDGTTVQDWTTADNTGTDYSTWQYQYTFPSAGEYYIQKRATDSFGNAEGLTSGKAFIVDDKLPTSQVTSPQANENFKLQDMTIEGVSNKNNGGNVNQVKIKITKANQTIVNWTKVTSPQSNYATWFYNLSLNQLESQGEYQIYTQAFNELDNEEAIGGPLRFSIDSTNPTTPSSLDVFDGSAPALNTYLVALNWAKSTDAQTKVEGYLVFGNDQQLTIEDQKKVVGDQELSTDQDTKLFIDEVEAGNQQYTVKAIDQVGNISNEVKEGIEVKQPTKAEIQDISVEPSDKVEGKNEDARTTAIVTFNTTLPSSSYLEYGEGMILNKEYSNNKLNQAHMVSLTDLKPGQQYGFKIKSIDQNGNTITSDKQTFTATPVQHDKTIIQIIIEAIRDSFDWLKRAMAATTTTENTLLARVRGTKTASIEPAANRLKVVDISTNDQLGVLVIYESKASLSKEQGSIATFTQTGDNYLIDTNVTKGKKATYYLADDKEGTRTSVVVGMEDNSKPAITEIGYQELAIGEESVDYLITFETDMPAKGSVTYQENQYSEQGFNHSHAIILADLTPGEIANFKVKAEAENKQVSLSSNQSFVATQQADNIPLSQIIIDAIMDAFQWAKSWFGQ